MLEVVIQKRLAGFQLNVAFTAGEKIIVLFGPSGSGKSLTLRAIAGIIQPDAGSVVIDGHRVYDSHLGTALPPPARRVGYVPQHYALFPHLTAAQNIAFGLRGLPRWQRRERVATLVELLELRGLEGRYPRELSGGQQQRVALARALAIQPRLLLLDEPFAALDVPLREALRQELLQIQTRLGVRVVLVTHDLTDAFVLGQRLIIYDGGQVIQQGAQEEIFFHPATRRVAELVGMGNILPAVVEQSEAHTLWLRWQGYRIAAPPAPLAAGSPVYLCIRPTQILIVRPDRFAQRERENLLSCTIVDRRLRADTYTLHLRLDHSEADYDLELALPAYVYHRLALDVEQQVVIELRRQYLHVMPRDAPSPPIFESNP